MKIASLCLVPALLTQAAHENPQAPRYELQLSIAELSFLQSSAVNGVGRYGGDADYELRFAKVGEEVQAELRMESKLLIDVWTYWVKEQMADSLAAVDLARLAPADRLALETGKSVYRKLASSKEDPRYDTLSLRGRLETDGPSTFLVSDLERLRIEGRAAEDAARLAGREALVQGSIRELDVLTADSLREVHVNTLDLFVMSHCPFGRQAVHSVVEELLQLPAGKRPALRLRYIFYEQKDEQGNASFTALHGEPEIVENLVQMVLQEQYPEEVFLRYLLERAGSASDWRELATKVGLSAEDLEVVDYRIVAEREALIRREHESATKTFGIHDGSPVYVWEGEVSAPSAIPFLRQRSAVEPRVEQTCSSEISN